MAFPPERPTEVHGEYQSICFDFRAGVNKRGGVGLLAIQIAYITDFPSARLEKLDHLKRTSDDIKSIVSQVHQLALETNTRIQSEYAERTGSYILRITASIYIQQVSKRRIY